MVLGMVFGAWMFVRHGWPGVWGGAAVVAVVSIVDRLFGLEIGRHIAEWTLRVIQ